MKTFDYVIKDPQGIHARPAGELVKLTKEFSSTIQIEKEGKKVDCKKIFGIMGLGAKQGQTVSFVVDGEDEEKASEAIIRFMNDNL